MAGPFGQLARQRTLRGLAVGTAGIAVVSAVIATLQRVVPVYAFDELYLLAILPVAAGWGFAAAATVAVASMLTFDFFFTPPLFTLTLTDPYTLTTVALAVASAYLVSALAGLAQRRARQTEALAAEQAALRRVATLVAAGPPAEELFAAVTAEAGRLLGCDYTVMSRYDPDGTATVVHTWATPGAPALVPVARRFPPGERNLHALVARTHRPARVDSHGQDGGAALAAGVHSAVGAPIAVEGRLWGVIIAASRRAALPADTEGRLGGFVELVATAVANAESQAKLAESQAQLTASRARIVATADATRRRIERDLHDGVQQHLISLGLRTRTAQAMLPSEAREAPAELNAVVDGLTGVLDELREITRGIHPAALAQGGLRPALRALAHRSPVPVRLDVGIDGRLPEPVELAAYYTVAEALTNAAKHAQASVIDVCAAAGEGVLRIEVCDDGRGGATAGAGSGLVGLTDRVEALGGRLAIHSPPGAGTTLHAMLPLTAPTGPETTTPESGSSAQHRPRPLDRPRTCAPPG